MRQFEVFRIFNFNYDLHLLAPLAIATRQEKNITSTYFSFCGYIFPQRVAVTNGASKQ